MARQQSIADYKASLTCRVEGVGALMNALDNLEKK